MGYVALDPAEQLLVELDPEVGVQPALEEDLVAAEGERLLDLGRELLLAEQVAFLRGQVAVERAERALGHAHVRVVDVAVDDVGDEPLGVQPLADGVGQHPELEQRGVADEGDALVAGEPLARQTFRSIASGTAMEPQLRDAGDDPLPVGPPVELGEAGQLLRPQRVRDVRPQVALVQLRAARAMAIVRQRDPGQLREPGPQRGLQARDVGRGRARPAARPRTRTRTAGR